MQAYGIKSIVLILAAAFAGGARGEAVRWWDPATEAARVQAGLGWLKLNGELRTRFESPTGVSFVKGADDRYVLTRIRLGTLVTAKPWLKFYGELQDVRAPGYNAPVPGGSEDSVDLRRAWVEVGDAEAGLGMRVGRQTLRYGAGRLVWDPDWGSAGQSFDAIRMSGARGGIRLDAFAASVVAPQDGAFDRSDLSTMLYGVYGVINRWGSGLRIDGYGLLKSSAVGKNELGKSGALDVYTTGMRAVGAQGALEWETEMALQRGHVAGKPVRAWAGAWNASWQVGDGGWWPRIGAAYLFASGDRDGKDGVKGTFDTLYPSVHLRNGMMDRIGWANIHDVSAQAGWKVSKRVKVTVADHEYWLASLNDGLYTSKGSVLIKNTKAAGRRVGRELSALAELQWNRQLSYGVGFGHLLAGRYLRDSARSSGSQAYLFAGYRF